MAPAGNHGKGLARRRCFTHLNLLGRVIHIGTPRTQPGATEVATATGRHRHHTEHHTALLDQRNVDGELFAAGDKLLGAIQRVHQPPALPAGTHALVDISIFFGQHRDARIECGKARQDQMVSGQVCRRHRRIIRLGGDRHIGAPERQNHFTRLASQLNHRGNIRVP